MNAIITDLLELSRLESTDGEAPREPIDVPRMLERLHRDALASSDRPRHVLLELESADGLFGAAHEIESAFTNLLVNGLKYTLVGRHRAHALVDRRGGRLFLGDRHRHRHPRRTHSAPHRALLPGRCGTLARRGRLRARACDRQACPAAPRRLARCAQHRRQGQHIHLSFPRSESAHAGRLDAAASACERS